MAHLVAGLPRAISFSGCGFLGVYHIGVIKCLQAHGASLLDGIDKYGGASGGGLAAAVLCVAPEQVSMCKKIVYDLAAKVRALRLGAFSSGFNLSKEVEKMAETVLPDNAHELASGRLYLSLTRYSERKNVIVSSYPSRADLIRCLVCTCHIPIYSGRVLPILEGKEYYDGGFSNNLPSFDAEDIGTLYVTPFSGSDAYVCPADNIGRWNIRHNNQEFCVNIRNISRGIDAIFPPSEEQLDRYFNQGYVDALRHLIKIDIQHPKLFNLGPKEVHPDVKTKILSQTTRKKRAGPL